MRPADDLGFRARNWFWYWRVRELSGLSNEQLDRKAFGDVGRKRHFERIQHSASSPDEVALVQGKTLLEVVDRWSLGAGDDLGAFSTATAAFHSPLWDFLTRRDPKPDVYTDYIEHAIAARGWHRVNARDLGLYRAFLGPTEPALGPAESMAYSAMLHKLVNEATADSLALLIALFREALYAVALQEAVLIRSAIVIAASWMGHLLQLPGRLTQLLSTLLEDRVLANVWLTEADWREQSGTQRGSSKSSRDRLKEFRAWVTWYIKECPRAFGSGSCRFPIVPSSPRIAWLEANREALAEAYLGLYRHESDPEIALFVMTRPQCEPVVSPDQYCSMLAQAMGCPCEASPRFYSERPALELGRLCRAY